MKVKVIFGDLVIPEAEATRFECRTRKSNGSYTDIVVENAGVKYYHVSPTGETVEIGDLYAYLRYLRQCNAMWLTRKSNGAKPKTKRIFLTRDEAKRLLRYGYSMVFLSLDKAVTITPMEGYAGCSCSDGKTIKIDDIPAGDYAVNWTVEPLKETFEEFQARQNEEARKQAERDAEAERLEAEKLEAERIARMSEEARKQAERDAEAERLKAARLETENVRLKEAERKTPTPVEQPKRGFKWWFERVGLFVGGIAVGALAMDRISNHKN